MRRFPWLLSILLVNPDGSGPYPTIQSAINAAVDGDEVHLAEGGFYGPGNRDMDLQGKTIIIKGIGSNASSIWTHEDGRLHRAFTFKSNEGPDTRIENVSFFGGETDSLGIICILDSSPTLLDCTFLSIANICVFNMGGSPLIEGCAFYENGISIRSIGGYIKIEHTWIQDNWANGGGVVRIDSGYIENSNLMGNEDYALTVTPGGSDCVMVINTEVYYQAIQTLPGACVRILKEKHADDFAPLSLSPLSWAAIKVKYR